MKITISSGTIHIPDSNSVSPYNEQQLSEIFDQLVVQEGKLSKVEIESLLNKGVSVQELIKKPRYGGEESLFPYGPEGHI